MDKLQLKVKSYKRTAEEAVSQNTAPSFNRIYSICLFISNRAAAALSPFSDVDSFLGGTVQYKPGQAAQVTA